MTHVRQTIREAAAAALVPAVDAEVFSSLVFPTDESDLPIVHVHIDEEDSEYTSMTGKLIRRASMVVTAIAQSQEYDLDNDLDALSAQIEGALGDGTFSSSIKQSLLVRTEVSRDAGSRASGQISLTFEVTYLTDDSNGEIAL